MNGEVVSLETFELRIPFTADRSVPRAVISELLVNMARDIDLITVDVASIPEASLEDSEAMAAVANLRSLTKASRWSDVELTPSPDNLTNFAAWAPWTIHAVVWLEAYKTALIECYDSGDPLLFRVPKPMLAELRERLH